MDGLGNAVIKPFPVAPPPEIMVQMHPAFKGNNRKSYEVLYNEGAEAYSNLTAQYRALEESYKQLRLSKSRGQSM